MYTGYGFVDENLEILCIKRIDDVFNIFKVPWREANPKDVIVHHEPSIVPFLKAMSVVPKINTGEIDLDKFEAVSVTIDDNKRLWIG